MYLLDFFIIRALSNSFPVEAAFYMKVFFIFFFYKILKLYFYMSNVHNACNNHIPIFTKD